MDGKIESCVLSGLRVWNLIVNISEIVSAIKRLGRRKDFLFLINLLPLLTILARLDLLTEIIIVCPGLQLLFYVLVHRLSL